MARLAALRQLAACLAGAPPRDCDWPQVVALANQSLITPQLAAALAPRREEVPADILGFLEEVRRRNQERNRRLWDQLNDAAAALNAAGVQPTVLKGAALRATGGDAEPFDRLLSDLDLLVEPSEAPAAVAALQAAGFDLFNRYDGAAVHVVAELGRPQDVGLLDLHQRAPGPPWLAETADLAGRRRPLDLPGGRVQLPDPAAQVLYLTLHDQFHDGDYWRGGFDLRHLTDLARLTPRLTAEDWAWLPRACGTRLARGALEAQLLAAHRLAGAPLPAWPGLRPRWTYGRWRLQYAWPRLKAPLAILAALIEAPDVLAHRAADRAGLRRMLGDEAAGQKTPSRRIGRLRKIFRLEMGKI